MKKTIVVLLTILLITEARAQCYQVSQVPFSVDSLTVPTTFVPSFDDVYSDKIPIGFHFCFYGEQVDSLVIGTNGVICFDLAQANSYNPWPITASIPSNSNPLSAIFMPWQDLYTLAGGTISYQLTGSAPFRQMTIDFNNIRMYSCTTLVFTGQVKLYETSNNIQMNLIEKHMCAWNGAYAIMGIQNKTGTFATVVPGRNYPSVWTASNESWLFTPTCNVCSGVGINEINSPDVKIFFSGENKLAVVSSGNYKTIKVCDILGRDMRFIQEGNTIQLNNAQPGIYIVSLEVNGVRVTRKVMMN